MSEAKYILKFSQIAGVLPASDYEREFFIERRKVTYKPKIETYSTEWNGNEEDFQYKKQNKVSLNFSVTEEEAQDLYNIEMAKFIYLTDIETDETIRYDFENINDRELAGEDSEMRSIKIELVEYTETIVNLFDNDYYEDATSRIIIYNQDTSNVPEDWITNRNDDKVLVYYSIFDPLVDYENEREQDDRTGQNFTESIKYSDFVDWRTYQSKEDTQLLKKYAQQCDTVVIVENENYEILSGVTFRINSDKSVDITAGDLDATTLAPGMKFQASDDGFISSQTFTVDEVQDDDEFTIVETPILGGSFADFAIKMEKFYTAENITIESSNEGFELVQNDIKLVYNGNIHNPFG